MEQQQTQRQSVEERAQAGEPDSFPGPGEVERGQRQPGGGRDRLVQHYAGQRGQAANFLLGCQFHHAQELPHVAGDVAHDVGEEPDSQRLPVAQRATEAAQDVAPQSYFPEPAQPQPDQRQKRPTRLESPFVCLQRLPLAGQ